MAKQPSKPLVDPYALGYALDSCDYDNCLIDCCWPSVSFGYVSDSCE